MKKLATLFILIFIGFSSFGQSSLVNGNFEGWFWAPHPTHAQQGFYEPQGPFFHTLNILDTIQAAPGLTVYRSDSAHSGNYAARVITREISLMQVIIPGVIGNIIINWTGMTAILGEPFTWATKPTRFQGYYMSFPIENDSSAAILLLSKWDNTKKQRDTVAYTKLIFHGTVDTYTLFDEPIDYWDSSKMPDSITVLLLSCGGYNAKHMMGSVGQVGSTAYFDDVTLTDIAGFQYMLMPEVNVRTSPNPTTGLLKVELSEVLKNGLFEVFNLQGKHINTYSLNGISSTFHVGDLSNGTYCFKITQDGKVVNTGTFIVTK